MTKKAATVRVIGPIGNFAYVDDRGKKVQVNGMQLVDLIAQITSLPPDTKELTVEVGGLGGAVPVAKAMRGYLKSIQPRMAVTTKQVGDIASAHTIIFTSGTRRIAAKGINPETGAKFTNMVHNPWIGHTSGDADALEQETASLRLTEQEFIDMYGEDIGISAEAIAPLMKAESFFDADQAVSLKFATETYEALNQAAYQSNNTMKGKKKLSFGERLAALLKGEIDGEEQIAAAPPAALMGKPTLIGGQAAPDGVYTVVGGVVTKLEAVAEEQAEDATPPAASGAADKGKGPLTAEQVAAIVTEVMKGKKATKGADPDDDDEEEKITSEERIAIAVAKAINSTVDEKINAFKKSTKTSHVPVGFRPENKVADAAEWDRSFKANEHGAMRRDNPARYEQLFYAKYGRMPN